MPSGLNEEGWRQLSDDGIRGMQRWRHEPPKATLREIESELDACLTCVRARLLEDLALHSAAVWQAAQQSQASNCPQCASPLEQRGLHPRTLLTTGGHQLNSLERHPAQPLGVPWLV